MARKKNKKLLKGERVLRTFILLLIIGNIFGTSLVWLFFLKLI